MHPGWLYHESDLQIQEYYTDTSGYTEQVFAMCHLLGFRFAPRMRDLPDKKLYTLESTSSDEVLSPLLGGKINVGSSLLGIALRAIVRTKV